MRIFERTDLVRAHLQDAGLPERDAAYDAELLVRHALGWDRAQMLSARRDAEPPELADRLEPIVARRRRREPMAYILGHREFWGLEFEVTPDVLIPRPETEFLVEEGLARLRPPGLLPPPLVVDVGTGSGCIAVAYAVERPDARVIASDLSSSALDVARRNAARNGVGGRVRFVRADLLAGIHNRPDLIVCNPPYVKPGDLRALSREVSDNEPHMALFGADADGLGTIRRLLAEAEALLPPGGWLLFEFGYGQDEHIPSLVAAHRALHLERIREDLQGIPRTAIVRHD